MSLPDLAALKWHLRLDPEPDTESDPQLEAILAAAIDHAEQYLGRPIPWSTDEASDVPVPASVRAAVLLIAADLHENREAQFVGVSVAENPAVHRLLHFYRVGLGV